MPDIVPFKGYLPTKEKAEKIVTQSADNYSAEQVKAIVLKNPLSYLNVIFPDYSDNTHSRPHSMERFNKIYYKFREFTAKNILTQDNAPCYYIYTQSHQSFEFTGIIAAINVEDYLQQKIKVHEHTLSERENKLKEYLKHCKINAEPVLFFYDEQEKLNNLIADIKSKIPNLDFEKYGIRHRLWRSDTAQINNQIKNTFSSIPCVYIGDGHHRSASSVLLYKELLSEHKSVPNSAKYFLGAFFPKNELKVFSFHRLLKDIVVPSDFISQLSALFEIQEIHTTQYPLATHHIGMYWDKRRFLLKLREQIIQQFKTHAQQLDADILSQLIFKQIFDIQDIRNNKNVFYFPAYNTSIADAEKMIDDKRFEIAFFTDSVSVEAIKTIALNNEIMPPKSTYVLPKLLNALVLYSLENS